MNIYVWISIHVVYIFCSIFHSSAVHIQQGYMLTSLPGLPRFKRYIYLEFTRYLEISKIPRAQQYLNWILECTEVGKPESECDLTCAEVLVAHICMCILSMDDAIFQHVLRSPVDLSHDWSKPRSPGDLWLATWAEVNWCCLDVILILGMDDILRFSSIDWST